MTTLDEFQADLEAVVNGPFLKVEWFESEATTYIADAANIGPFYVEVSLEDEGPYRPAYYWDITSIYGTQPVVADGWAGSIKRAKTDALIAAYHLLEALNNDYNGEGRDE